MILYGIKSCDTCKKALKALGDAGWQVTLHDVREMPLDPSKIEQFQAEFGEKLLNTRSTTWRGLDGAERAMPLAAALQKHPTLMKRPVLEDGAVLTLGWTPEVRAAWLDRRKPG